MDSKIENLKKIRNFLLDSISDLSTDQLNKIPAGFNNNIIWNLGHLISAQQGVCYFRSGNKMIIDNSIYLDYKPGSKPERYIDNNEINIIKQLFTTTLDQFDLDLKNNLFLTYNSFTTRYGVELNNINDAIDFLPHHEGLHTGYIAALKRLV